MYKKYFKRLLDILGALIAMPLFLIIFIPVAILIKIEDGGPVFYSANRIGMNKKFFKMFKFRSMRVNAPDVRLADGSTYNGKDDPRVTKIGRFLRESSLDEIPQVLNVLIGDMSLIGPRPDVNSNELIPEEYNCITDIRPGISGYNQAYFRNETNRLEKMKNDLYYHNHISFLMDFKVFVKTIIVIVKREKTYKEV